MNFNKIVSLSPSVTEILFFLKSGGKVIGVTEHCARMKQAKNKETVGSFIRPDIEKVVSLNPDLVIAYRRIHDGLLDELKRRNIDVLIFAPTKVEEILNEIEKIGNAAGSGDLAKSLTSQLEKRIDVVRKKVSGRALPRVLRLMKDAPITIPSSSSYQYDAIIIAGAMPMFFSAKEARTQVALEDVVRFDPQIIIRCKRGKLLSRRVAGDIKNWEKWKNISAVKEERIFSLSCELSCRSGPRIVNTIEKMAGFFHPEVF